MFSKFLGKGNKSEARPDKSAVDLRGLEVTEDDPDTVWSMWDEALAEQDSRLGELKPDSASAAPGPLAVAQTASVRPTGALSAAVQPTATEINAREESKEQALKIVELHHHRIANTIRSLWADRECGTYINGLIMSGADGQGKARVGFNQEAVEAMMVLSDLHQGEFGQTDTGGGLGSRDQSGFAGLDKFR